MMPTSYAIRYLLNNDLLISFQFFPEVSVDYFQCNFSMALPGLYFEKPGLLALTHFLTHALRFR